MSEDFVEIYEAKRKRLVTEKLVHNVVRIIDEEGEVAETDVYVVYKFFNRWLFGFKSTGKAHLPEVQSKRGKAGFNK